MNYESGLNNNNKNNNGVSNNDLHRESNNRLDSFSDSSRIEKTNFTIIEARIDATINIYIKIVFVLCLN